MAMLIPLRAHPSNKDKTAKLVSGSIYKGRDIYSVRGGYIALIGDRAFADLFATKADAERAQAAYDAATERTDQGEQTILPGAERSARQAAQAREDVGHGKIRSKKPQKDPDGLFAAGKSEQPRLF